MQFRCQWVDLRVETTNTPFTSACERGDVLRIPISHGEGSYYADPETLAMRSTPADTLRLPLLHARRRGDDRRQSQRLAGEHSWHRQRRRQRAGHDAPSGAVLRGRPGRHGRTPHLRVRAESHGVTGAATRL